VIDSLSVPPFLLFFSETRGGARAFGTMKKSRARAESSERTQRNIQKSLFAGGDLPTALSFSAYRTP
jgi:hypothetical protein